MRLCAFSKGKAVSRPRASKEGASDTTGGFGSTLKPNKYQIGRFEVFYTQNEPTPELLMQVPCDLRREPCQQMLVAKLFTGYLRNRQLEFCVQGDRKTHCRHNHQKSQICHKNAIWNGLFATVYIKIARPTQTPTHAVI